MFKGMLKNLKNSKGFTLLEAALTTVILSVTLWSSLAMISTVNASTHDSDLKMVASQLANEKIESLLAEKAFDGYDAVNTTSGTANAEQLTGVNEGFTRSTTVTEVSSSDLSTPESGSGLKLVVVTVSWGDGENQSIAVTTLIGDNSQS